MWRVPSAALPLTTGGAGFLGQGQHSSLQMQTSDGGPSMLVTVAVGLVTILLEARHCWSSIQTVQCLVSGFATAVGCGTPGVVLDAVGHVVILRIIRLKVTSKAMTFGTELSRRAEIVISTQLVRVGMCASKCISKNQVVCKHNFCSPTPLVGVSLGPRERREKEE